MRRDDLLSSRTHPFSGTDIWDLVQTRGQRSGDQIAFVWHPYDESPRAWTYRELARDAAGLAAGLQRRGIGPGDRVLIHLDNCPEFVIAWYACAAVGAVAVTTNTRSVADEMRYLCEDSQPACAITGPQFAEMISACAPQLTWQAVRDEDSWTSLAGDPGEFRPRAPDPMAPMSLQYTSGTTSRPKGVLWTHANALWAARVNAVHEDLHPSDCHLTYLPLFHANALGYQMLASLWVGARLVLVPKWSTSRFWDVSMQHGCTWLSLVGLSARALATGATGEIPDGHSYRLFGCGVCDMPFDDVLGVKTVGWWGMTETISHPIVGNPYTPDHPMSMGRQAPEYQIAVVRDDGLTPVEPEETGHLLIKGTRGLSLFAGYLNQPVATADSFDEDGWFRTGDRVTVHGDGYLSFADRAKDMLKVGAENVAASEIERVILATGLVAEVAVVGRPDDKLDEVPVAFVVPWQRRDSLVADVEAACAQRLADFKVPRAVYDVRDLPRSTLNKINKAELRRVAHAEADRSAAEEQWLSAAESDPSGDAR
ncbi:MAG: AMP-binding protein [Actinomycetota bacterium]|nr:AMP-binding protein [Actinomycetota bacterium]